MGAELWEHVVPYQDDLQKALDELKLEEFKAGRFRRGASNQEPTTPEEALRLAGDAGTCSVLDMLFVSRKPDLLTVCPLSREQLFGLFGTDKSSRNEGIANMNVGELIENGQGICVIICQ